MKTTPILFTGEMVRAILEGRKTQTRRLVKPQPEPIPDDVWKDKRVDPSRKFWWPSNKADRMVEIRDMSAVAPLGTIGDRLWVREKWCIKMVSGEFVTREDGNSSCWYEADGIDVEACDENGSSRYRKDGSPASPWHPSIHMPRWASRLTLEITGVRVERVQSITEEDAFSEGVTLYGTTRYENECRDAFRALWDSIYHNWSDNPWVWVYDFKRI